MASLTTKTVEKIIRIGLAGMTNDGDGLYLKVGRSSGASWIFRYLLRRKLAYDLERISRQSVLPLLSMLSIFPARPVGRDIVESNVFERGCLGSCGGLS